MGDDERPIIIGQHVIHRNPHMGSHTLTMNPDMEIQLFCGDSLTLESIVVSDTRSDSQWVVGDSQSTTGTTLAFVTLPSVPPIHAHKNGFINPEARPHFITILCTLITGFICLTNPHPFAGRSSNGGCCARGGY